jgi:hypothetical protein
VIGDPQADALGLTVLKRQLHESIATLDWALGLVPDGWTHKSPYGRISREEGAWSVAMNLAHMALYEERLPTSVLRSLQSGGDGVGDTWFKEPSPWDPDAVELAAAPVGTIMSRLKAALAVEFAIADQFTGSGWSAPSTTAWAASGIGPSLWSPARILSKSLQHTWEHGNSILKVALYAPRELTGE